MSQTNISFKKRKHFLDLIKDTSPEKILFCPIDVSKHFHVSILHNIKGEVHCDFFDFSASKLGFDFFTNKLEQVISKLSSEIILIGMEPTSIYYENLLFSLNQRYSSSRSPKFQLCILDPAAVSDNRKQHSLHCKKSDYIDAAAIGELLTRGLYTPVHISSPELVKIKELCRVIKHYRKQQLCLWNRFLCRLDRVFPNLLIEYKDELPLCKQPQHNKLLDDLIDICPDPYDILELTNDDLITLFHQKGRPLGNKKAEKIKLAAHRALLLPIEYQKLHLELFGKELETLDFLGKQIFSLIELTPARHLFSIAGNSMSLSAELIAAMEDWTRYSSIQYLWASAGLNPTEKQSGSTCSKPKVSKSGSVYLRNAIYKMTSTVVWHEPTFGIPCFERLIESRPFVPTILHVGRKLTSTALAILKSDSAFEPPFADYALAKEKLFKLQSQYLKQKNQKQ
ncbi:MAG: transposase family [bacterium]|nr:MAG: transposase family [bacterium]